ncbi:esterase/lipase family protein [Ectopseudomonas alcaliphila]|uniref:Alpha/beta fold hydrolase n=1 Tax=Ectopseudomonas alcaliphila TaxID=101564 RepID=A0A1G6TIG2_9GAMM|nr:alpha/beta fold hydrolase [Pseudomonas alcaliphila]MDX5991297.1 alpha/beta fold hydrolase [Pseudomonas alcaliphila]PKM33894.1 MAG: alpha/beta hydrolase [Gammaproteobacteria bacterium HGW-Gammaproteobacteria-12]SDD28863.1 triacylglycerol lipase [Pseudomonas alcaliphila]
MRRVYTAAVATFALLGAIEAQANYTKTKYPIVLVHGVTGFNTIGGLVNYFHTIPWNLERDGARVHVASVAAFNDSEQRGAELARQIVPWATAGGGKVNLIGHSQGSPTSRVAASLRPDLVASVTSINGVNKGSKVADVIRGVIPPGGGIEGGANAIANALGAVINLLSGASNPQNGINALGTLTTAGTTALNGRHPWGVNNSSYCAKSTEVHNVRGHSIRYYSWTGNSSYTNVLDAADPFLAFTGLVFGSEKNDGLVGVCSTYLGQVIDDSYNMNHVDAINHLFGIRGWTEPVSLYRQHANRLKNKGV